MLTEENKRDFLIATAKVKSSESLVDDLFVITDQLQSSKLSLAPETVLVFTVLIDELQERGLISVH